MGISTIAPGRKKEIAEEFAKRRSKNEPLEEVYAALGSKYSLTHEEVVQIVVENEDPDPEDDGDGRQVA